jgi:transposase
MQITTIGLDIAKHVFQVHGINANEKVVVRKRLRRGQTIAYFAALPGVEACAASHLWARELTKFRPTVRLIPAKRCKGLRQTLRLSPDRHASCLCKTIAARYDVAPEGIRWERLG